MRIVLAWLFVAAVCAGCGAAERPGVGDTPPRIVVSTGILGDVVVNLVGGEADVEVLMPPNADPHDFAASAQQIASMVRADAIVVNGLGFEEGLVDTIEAAAADGVTVIAAADAIEPIPLAGESIGSGSGPDPHLFTDPVRMRDAAALIADELVVRVPALDTPAFRGRVARYLEALVALDAEVAERLAGVAPDRRILVTNHEALGYFADRYGFEVLGAIIPGGSTLAEPSAAELADLVRKIEQRGVKAVFAETSSPTKLADALAAEGAAVKVVELYSESLGEPGSPGETYVGMIRTNAARIAAALR